MQVLFAPTEKSVLSELTYLASDAEANSNSLTVDNSQGFSANNYLVIGRLGNEKTELKKIASITGNIITLSSVLSSAHSKNSEVQKILYNQRMFYRSTSKTGTYSLLTDGTVNIEVDRPNGTFFEDSTGTSSHWYKAIYYNSTTEVKSSLDDAIASKAAEADHYTSIYDIRKQAGFEEAFGISDEVVSDYREEAENEFESSIVSIYIIPLSPKPKLARQIINLLGAGNLLIKEYGMEADIEISKSGQRMLDRAYSLLGKIVDGTIKLVDDDGKELSTKASAVLSSTSNEFDTYPDRGALFNIGDEQFQFKNPENPTS